jgi:hypothetical protein
VARVGIQDPGPRGIAKSGTITGVCVERHTVAGSRPSFWDAASSGANFSPYRLFERFAPLRCVKP